MQPIIKPKGQWTIHDIAREVGASAKTVSRVLNHKSGVGRELRDRILRLMEDVGYQPHIGARSLRSRQSACIGVTMPASPEEAPLSQGFLLWMFAQLYEMFGQHGEYIGFDMNPHGAGIELDYGRGVWQHLFKACIIAGPLRMDDTVMARIHASGLPYLALGRLESLPECSSATVDYQLGAYLSTRHLIQRGHRNIALLSAFSGFQPGQERLQGYTRALEEANIAFDENLVRSSGFDAENVAATVHRLLANHQVTALVDSSGTEDGVSLSEGARRAGRTPGKDFDLVAWTYVSNAAVLHTACAHLWLPVREAAAQGIEGLAGWLAGTREGPVQVLYPPVLDTRAFTIDVPRPRRLFDLHA